MELHHTDISIFTLVGVSLHLEGGPGVILFDSPSTVAAAQLVCVQTSPGLPYGCLSFEQLGLYHAHL